MKKGILLSLFLMILLVHTVSAGVYFSYLNEEYNLGEILTLEVQVDSIDEGPLTIKLECDGDEIDIFHGPVIESLDLPLTETWIKDLRGNCKFLGEYNGETEESNTFYVSSKLNVGLDISSYHVNPGESITVSGKAKRLNGEFVNEGEVEILIPSISSINSSKNEECLNNCESDCEDDCEDYEDDEYDECEDDCYADCEDDCEEKSSDFRFLGQIKEGDFSVTFNMPKETDSGEYDLNIYAYEILEDERGNMGSVIADLNVFQVLTSLVIAINNQNVDPGENLNIKVSLLDQSDLLIDEEVSVSIKNEKGEEILSRIIDSGEVFEYEIPSETAFGYYSIEVVKENFTESKKFYINEKEIAEFEIVNDTLTVTNVGNVPYNNDIQIELDGKPFVKSVELDLGESVEFKLVGSNSNYNIKISDGDKEVSQEGVYLTGMAIGVNQVDGESMNLVPVLWILIIIILLIVVIFFFRTVRKKSSFAYPFLDKLKIKRKKNEDIQIRKIDTPNKNIPGPLVTNGKAEQVLVLNGHKNKATILALKTKNKLNHEAKHALERAIEPVYSKRGAIFEQGDYLLIVFSPLLTRTFKNETEAGKVAGEIKNYLREYNKKVNEKIEFGIGVNSGDIINIVEKGKLKFTSIGNSVLMAKKLAEVSDKNVLISKNIYEAGINGMKAEKKEVEGKIVYELMKVLDNEANSKFISEFLKKQESGN